MTKIKIKVTPHAKAAYDGMMFGLVVALSLWIIATRETAWHLRCEHGAIETTTRTETGQVRIMECWDPALEAGE